MTSMPNLAVATFPSQAERGLRYEKVARCPLTQLLWGAGGSRADSQAALLSEDGCHDYSHAVMHVVGNGWQI